MALSRILKELKFKEEDFKPKEHSWEYESKLGTLNFVELAGDTEEEINENFYKSHREIWNEDISELFVAIINDEDVLICDSKTKPDDVDPINTAKIRSFSGVNTPQAKRYLELLKKDSIDKGYFWEKFYCEIKKRERNKKRKPIDIDLLKNLKDKKSKIKNYLKDFPESDEIAQKLIDRCLFIRFLEDRIERNKLKNLLENRDVKGFLDLFDYYNDCLNGDLFEEGDIPTNINKQILVELNEIFGKHYKYKDNQIALVPYQFDKIPILLISHIYENLLKRKKRNSEGIVFTPENVVDYTIDEVFKSEFLKNKIENNNIRVLDPSCGSGIFLVKFFKRIVKEKKIGSQDIHKKSDLLQKSIYGIDINPTALRIAAFSLYLEIFDGLPPEIIKKEVIEKYEAGGEHFMFPGLKEKHLFNWNNVPGVDSEKLLKFLNNNLKIEWAENADIKKSDDGKSITINKDSNSLIIKLIGEKNKTILEINGVGSPEYILKEENGELNTYKENNLINRNSLFEDNIFKDEKFDLILGNPPWSYKEFSEDEKRKIKEKWHDVSNYDSSQCFLFKIEDWMDEDNMVGMVVNLSNFTNQNALIFRKSFLEKYSLDKFLNLINIKKITFGSGSEPACVLIFNKNHGVEKNDIGFIIPDMTQFSELTETIVIKPDDVTKVSQSELLDDDGFWHPCILGMNKYQELIKRIEKESVPLKEYSEDYQACARLYASDAEHDAKYKRQLYESHTKIDANYFPMRRSLKGIKQYIWIGSEKYLKYGSHLDRGRTIDVFKGHKLVVTRNWPVRAFSLSDTVILAENFNIIKFKPDYLHLFEAILNSNIAGFYLAAKYLQRPEGNWSKIDLEHLKKFPIPDLKDEEVINEIIRVVSKIKQERNIGKYKEQIDDLVFDLYDLDYYERQQIKDYHKIQKRKRKNLVTVEDMIEYVDEFIEGINPFIEKGYVLNAEVYICKFLGSLVKFNFSKKKERININGSAELKKLLGIIQYDGIEDIKNILEEEEQRICDDKALYLYKSNHLKDWTRTKALDDVRKEVGIIYENLPDK